MHQLVKKLMNNPLTWLIVVSGLLGGCSKEQTSGDTDKAKADIVIGHTSAYSGPASSYSMRSKTISGYFKKVNDEGGVNGHQIRFIGLDDGYNPARTVEQVRKLVEKEKVVALVGSLGASNNLAVRDYLNQKKIPQLFVASGGTAFGDYDHFPYTMGFQPSYQAEGRVIAEHLMATKPNAKVAVLYQNDDFGKDMLKGFEQTLGDKAHKMIVKKMSYEATDPTIDSQIVALQHSQADVFVDMTIPKFATQAIRKMHAIGWKADHYLSAISASKQTVLKNAGFEESKGVYSLAFTQDVSDDAMMNTQAVQDYFAFMKKYYPDGDMYDKLNVDAYVAAQVFVDMLRNIQGDITSEKIIEQAKHLSVSHPFLMEGSRIETSPTDYFPIEKMRIQQFDGKRYHYISGLL